MWATGYVKRVEKEGRVTIPKAVRKELSICIGDKVEISADADFVIVEKFKECCYICDNDKNIRYFKGTPICQDCIDELIKKI